MKNTPESPRPGEPLPNGRSSGESSDVEGASEAGKSVDEWQQPNGTSSRSPSSLPERELVGNGIEDQGQPVDISGRNDNFQPEIPLGSDGLDLDMILDIPLEITVELGRARMPIKELLQLVPGSAVSLSKLEGEPVDILANDRLIARGIVLVKDEKYGIQITEITGRLERLRGLR